MSKTVEMCGLSYLTCEALDETDFVVPVVELDRKHLEPAQELDQDAYGEHFAYNRDTVCAVRISNAMVFEAFISDLNESCGYDVVNVWTGRNGATGWHSVLEATEDATPTDIGFVNLFLQTMCADYPIACEDLHSAVEDALVTHECTDVGVDELADLMEDADAGEWNEVMLYLDTEGKPQVCEAAAGAPYEAHVVCTWTLSDLEEGDEWNSDMYRDEACNLHAWLEETGALEEMHRDMYDTVRDCLQRNGM